MLGSPKSWWVLFSCPQACPEKLLLRFFLPRFLSSLGCLFVWALSCLQ